MYQLPGERDELRVGQLTPPQWLGCLELTIHRDEFAPIKAAKQLRRGKRISEIEVIYGKQAADAAAVSDDNKKKPLKARSPPSGPLPELTPQFFESPFFRRFQVQSESFSPIRRHPLILQDPSSTLKTL